jgi:sporulation protein YqfC
MKLKRKIVRTLSERLGVPLDVSVGETFISVLGNQRVKVENQHGLLECTDQSIGLKIEKGIVRITGENLIIHELITNAVEVTGEIKSIAFLT